MQSGTSIVQQEPGPEYRLNAAVFIIHRDRCEVLAFERVDEFHWQCPQGGIDGVFEDARSAALRELKEETGIPASLVDVVYEFDGWLHYDWPKRKQEKHRARCDMNNFHDGVGQ
jgi:8-oxo-dGTP pyrophosphatase MutT (NUDIX family)